MRTWQCSSQVPGLSAISWAEVETEGSKLNWSTYTPSHSDTSPCQCTLCTSASLPCERLGTQWSGTSHLGTCLAVLRQNLELCSTPVQLAMAS